MSDRRAIVYIVVQFIAEQLTIADNSIPEKCRPVMVCPYRQRDKHKPGKAGRLKWFEVAGQSSIIAPVDMANPLLSM